MVTRYLEMKVAVVVDNNVRRRKVNAMVYTRTAVAAVAVAIAGVAAAAGRIAVAMM